MNDANLNTNLQKNSPMIQAIHSEMNSECMHIYKLSLEYGCDLNRSFHYDLNHYTAIKLAAWCGNIHIVELLYEKSADLKSTRWHSGICNI